MTMNLRSPSTLTASLNDQIREAGVRLRNRRRFVRFRGATLGQTLHRWMTAPAMLLLAGGLGFLMGELTRRQTPQSQGTDHSPKSGHPFFESALNLIKLVNWGHTLFTALPGTETQSSSPLEVPVQTPD